MLSALDEWDACIPVLKADHSSVVFYVHVYTTVRVWCIYLAWVSFLLPAANLASVPYVHVPVYTSQVDREYKVISALYGVNFPVPKPYLYCGDRAVIGTEFYIMEYVKVH